MGDGYVVEQLNRTYMLDSNRLARAAVDGFVHFSEGPACACQSRRILAEF
jgi:hypothetical protein